jgi:pimeloyl-ACP methyl ester carboxylesterase
MKAFAVLMLACVLGTTAAAQTNQPVEQLIPSDGYVLNVRVQAGSHPELPAIVLEAGGGLDSTQWAALQPELSAQTGTTVISYDRPGYGKSPLPERPYDIVAETEALHDALEQLHLANKYILVGHSYGGFLIQLFANRWPEEVKGLLFLDPNTPTTMLAFGSDADQKPMINPATPRQRANARVDQAGRKPFEAVYAAPLPLDIPVIVVSSEKPPFSKPRQIEVFRLSHQLLAASVEDGKWLVADGSNHMIPAQRPDIVIASVRELLAKQQGRF